MFHKDLQADIVRQNRGATILKESMLLQNKVIFKLFQGAILKQNHILSYLPNHKVDYCVFEMG